MNELLSKVKVPGVIPVLVLSGLTLYVAWYLPDYAVWLPFLFLGLSILANALAPDDPRVKQLVEMIRALLPYQPPVSRDIRLTREPGAPDSRMITAKPPLTPADIDKVVARGRMSKILWGG